MLRFVYARPVESMTSTRLTGPKWSTVHVPIIPTFILVILTLPLVEQHRGLRGPWYESTTIPLEEPRTPATLALPSSSGPKSNTRNHCLCSEPNVTAISGDTSYKPTLSPYPQSGTKYRVQLVSYMDVLVRLLPKALVPLLSS